jgi:hypothetical protein
MGRKQSTQIIELVATNIRLTELMLLRPEEWQQAKL